VKKQRSESRFLSESIKPYCPGHVACLVRERLRRQQLGRNRGKRRETRMHELSRGRYRAMGTRAHVCTYGAHTANFSPTNLQTYRTNPPSTGPSICGCTRRSSSLVHGGSTCLNPRAAAGPLARDRRDRKDTRLRPLLRRASLPPHLVLPQDPRHLPWPLDAAKGKRRHVDTGVKTSRTG